MKDYINIQNYRSVNQATLPEQQKWCISAKMQSSVKQVSVVMNNGKAYPYVCRYDVADQDVVIVGNAFPYEDYFLIRPTATTGCMGTATDVLDKPKIKKSHASEIDYVFSPTPTKELIAGCVKYLGMPGDAKTLQFNKRTDIIFPITFLARKLLAAASILAFPDIAGKTALSKAAAYIKTPQIIDSQMAELGHASSYTGIFLCDIQTDMGNRNKQDSGYQPVYVNSEEPWKSHSFQWRRDGETIPPEVNQYVNKYVYIAAISVMVRGGFLNLLNAFLSAKPPIDAFYDDILSDCCTYGNPQTIHALREYIAANRA